MKDQHSGLIEKLAQFTEAMAEGPKQCFRCEDIISAAAAFAGECCLRKAAIFDFDNHDCVPGQAIFSGEINHILSGDRTDWGDVPVTSVFGGLHNILTHFPEEPWDPSAFPGVAEIYRGYAAARGHGAPPIQWGYVPLTLAPHHAPRHPPLRAAFELRRFTFAVCAQDLPKPGDLCNIAQLSLLRALAKLRRAIDKAVAIRLAMETLNSMAKMAPVLPRHIREVASKAS